MTSIDLFALFLVFSLTVLLLCPYSVSQPYATASGAGSGGGPESDQIYVVAPTLEDCPNDTHCQTLPYYASVYINNLSNVVFWFLPGTHNFSGTWKMDNSRNISLLGGKDITNSDKTSGGTSKIVCQELYSGGINVSNSNFIVVENVAIAYCASALVFDATVYVTVRNVVITDSYNVSLRVSACQHFTLTSSQIYNSATANIEYESNGGTITINEITSIGSAYGLVFHQHPTEVSSLEEKAVRVNIFNSTIIMSESSLSAIYVESDYQDIDFNIDSVSVIGNKGGNLGIGFIDFPAEAGSIANYASARLHNVTIENIGRELDRLSANLTKVKAAAIFITSLRNLTMSDCTIKNNGGTGIVLSASTALLQGNITLTNNSGINGGGMALYSNSYIVLDSSASLQISNNSAAGLGGGIYVSQDIFYTLPLRLALAFCFASSIGEHDQPLLEVTGNKATVSGQNMYGAYVNNCTLPLYNGQETTAVQFWAFTDVNSTCTQTVISSDPVSLVLCDDTCVSTSKRDMTHAIPGQEFTFTVAAIGEQFGLTPAIISLSSHHIVLDSNSPDADVSVKYQTIKAQCTTVVQKLEFLKESVEEAFINGSIADQSLPRKVNVPVQIKITVLPCPPGFELSDEGICDCATSIQHLAMCNITSETIQRNTTSWVFPLNDSIMIADNCPFDYCNNAAFPSNNSNVQCNYNRNGTLCGGCLPGYSLTLGSNECHNCTGAGLVTYTIVVGCFLAGVGLVALLIGLNLTVSMGTINGFIFFANIVKIYEPIFRSDRFYSFVRLTISWVNLDLGIPSCFVPAMSACQKIGLQFAFPLYLLGIVVWIIVICKAGQWPGLSSSRVVRLLSGRVSLLIGSKAVPVLATLLLLSYTKFLRTTILILHKATVIIADCDRNTSMSTCEDFTVWYVDGNINYYSDCHSVLFGIGIVFSPFLILFTLFLLFFPLMERFLPGIKCWRSWHMRLKPWYDAYGGPYKDKYRSWIGVMLLARCVLALFAALENDRVANLSALGWVCLSVMSVLCFFPVYKIRILNALEMMYLVCLLLLALFFASNDVQNIQGDVVQLMAICSLGCIFSFHIYQCLLKHRLFVRRLVQKAKQKGNTLWKKKAQQQVEINDGDTGDNSVTSTDVTLSSVRFIELREPLLSEADEQP